MNLWVKTLIIPLFTLTLHADLTLQIGKRDKSRLDFMESAHVFDTLKIKQDPTQFAEEIKLLTAEEQQEYNAKFDKRYYSPWQDASATFKMSEFKWIINQSNGSKYFIDGQLIPQSWFKEQIANSNYSAINSERRFGITTAHTDLKIFPTDTDFYTDPTKNTDGFPFDINQNSSIHPNTPLFVSHKSADGQWMYVKSGFANGWIKTEHMCFVDSSFIDIYTTSTLGVIIHDDLYIVDEKNKYTIAKIGAVFPSFDGTYYTTLKNENGYGTLQPLTISQRGLIARKPIAFIHHNVAYISKQLLGEPYGWGGKLCARDCSAMTKDFFAPFGIYLPRNSKQQARDGKEYIDISNMTAEEKDAAIIRYGNPFRTLLFVPGHIVLYIGQIDDKPIIMHDYWGVRLLDGSKKVLGRSIITTTSPGIELENIKESSMLNHTLKAIINF